MNSTIKRLIFFVMECTSITGCATMFNRGPQSIDVRSSNNKDGIAVVVRTPGGAYPTELPTTVWVTSGRRDVEIKIVDECYDHTTIEVPKAITPMFWANIINFLGYIIDGITGKMWKYDSNVTFPVSEKAQCLGEISSAVEPLSREQAQDLAARNIYWKVDSEPQGAVVNYRINSSTQEVSSTPNTYVERTPYEGVQRLDVRGMTYENMKHLVISVEVSKSGYYSQKRDIAITAVMQTKAISLYFNLVKQSD